MLTPPQEKQLCRFVSPYAMFCSIVSLLAATLMIAGCERPQAAQAAPPQRPPPAVAVATATTDNVPVYIDAIGKTVAFQTVTIIPQVSGKIISAPVRNGAYVTKGELLFKIDPKPFEAARDAALATLVQNRAEAKWAEADFARTKELLPQKVVSQLEFDQKQSAMDVARAKIDGAQAAVDLAELNVKYTDILSPIDGRAGARLVDEGNIVKANEGAMLSVQQIDPIYAEFTVTENDLGTVRKYLATRRLELGNEANMGLKAWVDVPGDSNQILTALGGLPTTQPVAESTTQPTSQPNAGATAREAVLTFLDNSVQNGTGTIKLRATVPNADRYFWPGQFVNVQLVLTTRKNAVLVPATAQQIGQQGPFVYVVGPDQSAQMRPIVPGQRHGDLMVIDSGLSGGENVIVTGQMTVTPGGKVSVINAKSQEPGARSQ